MVQIIVDILLERVQDGELIKKNIKMKTFYLFLQETLSGRYSGDG